MSFGYHMLNPYWKKNILVTWHIFVLQVRFEKSRTRHTRILFLTEGKRISMLDFFNIYIFFVYSYAELSHMDTQIIPALILQNQDNHNMLFFSIPYHPSHPTRSVTAASGDWPSTAPVQRDCHRYLHPPTHTHTHTHTHPTTHTRTQPHTHTHNSFLFTTTNLST